MNGVRVNDARLNTVNLMDFPGFEMSRENSLEGLIRNYMNEYLQQIYIKESFFTKEFDEFYEEGVGESLDFFPFKDNLPLLRVFDNEENGLFQLTDRMTVRRFKDQDLLH